MNEGLMSLKRHEGVKLMTAFSFLSELILLSQKKAQKSL